MPTFTWSPFVLGKNKNILRHFQLLLVVFTVVVLTTSTIAYSLAATQLKEQLVLKCQALAATVAAVIAEDSDGYAQFLAKMDTQTDYYQRTKKLMMKIKKVNVQHVEYIYTTRCVDENTIMYVIGGEPSSSPVYTAPGVKDVITEAERQAYATQRPTMSRIFEETTYGLRLSAFQPIFHKDTGEFLGMVGADVISEQYNSIMRIVLIQTIISILAGLAVFALATHWFSGKVNMIVNRQRYDAHQAEQKLAMENATLERVSRMKSDLMTTISHEARTPLAVLASYAGLVSLNLKRKGADLETAADLDRVVSEAQRVAELIDSMKKLTLSDGVGTSRAELDFGELIHEVAKLYKPLLERNGVSLELDIEGEFPVYANPEELTQVVFNIVQNAKDHTEQGSVSISATKKDGCVTVSIADTGCGIEEDLLPEIFVQGVKGSKGGAGIGLAICKEIMEAHGGTISVTNHNGAVVTLTLPEYHQGCEDES